MKRISTIICVAILAASCSIQNTISASTSAPEAPTAYPPQAPTALATVGPSSVIGSSGLQVFQSDTFHVTFQYPKGWTEVDSGTADYAGDNGYFSVSKTNRMGMGALQMCQNDLAHNGTAKFGNEYGTSPQLQTLQVDDQSACVILPSEDQPRSQNGLAVLVVDYPPTVEPHALLFISADKDHILGFAHSLHFIP